MLVCLPYTFHPAHVPMERMLNTFSRGAVCSLRATHTRYAIVVYYVLTDSEYMDL